MKVKPNTAILLSALVVVVGVAVTAATGLWQTSGTATPRRLEAVQTGETAAGSETTEAGTAYDPADIRGSYTFGEIASLYGLPLNELATAFGLSDAEAEGFQVKGLEKRYPEGETAAGTASVRMFVAYALGLPYTPTEDTYLPAAALPILTQHARMTEEQTAYVTAHTIP